MAEESKQSGLVNDESKTDRSIDNVSLDDSLSNLEEYLDFDIYNEDISIIADEANYDSPRDQSNDSSKTVHFTDSSSTTSNPIPLNLSSFNESNSDDYSDFDTKPFSEDDLDDILLKDKTSYTDDENSSSEDDEYSDSYSDSSRDTYSSDELDDTYDTDFSEDENITLGSDELDQILNPDEEEEESDFEGKSFFDTESDEEADEDGPIALSSDELDNITNSGMDDFDTDDFISEPPADLYGESETDEEIALSGDELNNLLESGNEDNSEDEDFLDGEAKSFFDSESEEDGPIALSPDELNNITNSEYLEDDGIETEDLSSGIESNEYGVSTENALEGDDTFEEENISLSGDELNNILESGEIEVEEEFDEDIDSENAKSFFDSEEEDESIALSPDELGNITAEEQDYEDNSEMSLEGDNFDLSETPDELDMNPTSNLFEEDGIEDTEIALSGDELNNLLESGEIETEESETMGSSFFEDNTEEDESIALSPDELGNITAEEQDYEDNSEMSLEGDNFDLSETPDELDMNPTSNLFEEDGIEDTEIALSGDELNNLLESGEIETEESESMGSSFFEDSVDEDESIALSPDELGNITAEGDYEEDNTEMSLDENNFELPETTDDFDLEGSSSNLFEEDSADEDEIALSGDELNNLLESGEIEQEEASYDNPIDAGMVIGDDDFVIDENSALSNLGEFDLEDSTPSDIKDYSDTLESFQFGTVKKEELKKVIS